MQGLSRIQHTLGEEWGRRTPGDHRHSFHILNMDFSWFQLLCMIKYVVLTVTLTMEDRYYLWYLQHSLLIFVNLFFSKGASHSGGDC